MDIGWRTRKRASRPSTRKRACRSSVEPVLEGGHQHRDHAGALQSPPRRYCFGTACQLSSNSSKCSTSVDTATRGWNMDASVKSPEFSCLIPIGDRQPHHPCCKLAAASYSSPTLVGAAFLAVCPAEKLRLSRFFRKMNIRTRVPDMSRARGVHVCVAADRPRKSTASPVRHVMIQQGRYCMDRRSFIRKAGSIGAGAAADRHACRAGHRSGIRRSPGG
jgi:hypothetical protein